LRIGWNAITPYALCRTVVNVLRDN